jgi:hypothetical protein
LPGDGIFGFFLEGKEGEVGKLEDGIMEKENLNVLDVGGNRKLLRFRIF